MDGNQVRMLNAVIKTLEESFPSNAFYVDMSKGNIETNDDDSKEVIEDLWIQLKDSLAYVEATGQSVKSYCLAFMKTDPYCRHSEIIARLQEVADNE